MTLSMLDDTGVDVKVPPRYPCGAGSSALLLAPALEQNAAVATPGAEWTARLAGFGLGTSSRQGCRLAQVACPQQVDEPSQGTQPKHGDQPPVKPEDQARQDIDRQLTACGWTVQDRPSMNIHAGPGVAVREFPVVKPDGKGGSVDYLLYAGAKAIGVV